MAYGTMFVMLDTDGYTDYRYAQLSPETLRWIKAVFDYAKENNLNILPSGHYPAITYQKTDFVGKDDFVKLLKEYNVPLYLSGHLHGRNVNVCENVAELVVEQLTTYPCSYALLDIDSEYNIYYHPQKLDISSWATESGQADEVFLRFEEIGGQVAEQAHNALVDSLCEKHYASAQEKKKRSEFFDLLSQCLREGTVYSNKEMLLSHPGYSVFVRICRDSNYAPWITSLFQNANQYTEGFIIKNGRISAVEE